MIILVRWQCTDGRDWPMLGWRCTHFERRSSKGTALVRKLLWPCTVMCTFEQPALITKLQRHQGEL